MLRLENVGMRYGLGPEILKDVSFELPSGSFHFLTGPSGAGKSSLLKLLYLAHRPSRGLMSMFGKELSQLKRSQLPALRRQVGVVFQDFRLLPHLSARDNVALPLRIAGVNEAELNDYAEELLTWVGLKDRMKARPATLSGGEKQRVAIARAVISRPKLLLADEPTGNLDQELGMRLLNLFEQMNSVGTTVLIATHDERLISSYSHPVLELRDGSVSGPIWR